MLAISHISVSDSRDCAFLKRSIEAGIKNGSGKSYRQVGGQEPADMAIDQLLPATYPVVPLSSFLLK